jgi:hypothetical protein
VQVFNETIAERNIGVRTRERDTHTEREREREREREGLCVACVRMCEFVFPRLRKNRSLAATDTKPDESVLRGGPPLRAARRHVDPTSVTARQ